MVWLALLVILLIFVILGAAIAVAAVRRREAEPPSPPLLEEDPATRVERQEALEARGTELLHRRIELDTRRGPLGGETAVYEAFVELERRLRAGEISEADFETEKIRLLGG